MERTPMSLIALIDLWSRCHRLTPSQRVLLETASVGERRTRAERLRISDGELKTLDKLFLRQTGRTVDAAVSEIRRIAERRALNPEPRKPYDRLAETLAESTPYESVGASSGT
ncbi:MAG: hypothetical protein AB8H86_25840 [Polyangiales bacterium]